MYVSEVTYNLSIFKSLLYSLTTICLPKYPCHLGIIVEGKLHEDRDF